ncbi:MAG: CIA30 family protein [Candidatus Omnitrophica bacterium]|nr:CIA30 family protein [Candidatus Omnitrophota bacterium]
MIRNYKRSADGSQKRFIKDGVFFSGALDKKAPWLDSQIKKDSRRGKVLAIRYNVKEGYGGYYIRLVKGKKGRYRRYNALQFWIKGDCKQIKVEIKDTVTHTYTLQGITSQWQNVTIPFSKFTRPFSIEPNEFHEIVFVLDSVNTAPKRGSFSLDNISFVYQKERRITIMIKKMDIRLNDIPIGLEEYFENTDITIKYSLSGSADLANTTLRFEASTDKQTWFFIGGEQVVDGEGEIAWKARYYPTGTYFLRYKIMKDQAALYCSAVYTLYIWNDFDEKRFLEKILKDTFQYFLKEHQPRTFLTKDRNGNGNVISTGACGFALTVYPLAAQRGFIPEEEAKKRVLTILNTYLRKLKNIDGFYQHWFDFRHRPVFEDEGVDSVETSYLAAGALFCMNFYKGEDDLERAIRSKAYKLIRRIKWPFMLGKEGKEKGGPLYWNYYKSTDEFHHPVVGFNECLITYIMALAAPHSVSRANFENWYQNYQYHSFNGEKVVFYPTLFTQHYSFMWIDPRSLKDKWITYFPNAQRATLLNREYCVKEMRSDIWGLTACDGPKGYCGYGANLPFQESCYDGTISPSASIGSLPYLPAPVLANIKFMYEQYPKLAYGKYGFYDSFNVDLDWSSRSFLGITQGTIYLQIENYLSGNVWNYFMKDESIKKALKKAEFQF